VIYLPERGPRKSVKCGTVKMARENTIDNVGVDVSYEMNAVRRAFGCVQENIMKNGPRFDAP
jgi:hypothetical protein